ncbi:hypothetical protein N0V83_001928 [Neocucurbitaria cava]|uniref:Uncharacterized protein n=1 Tax=Neocucurbitaria cava TaxID=798079 RepID=A0A9W8YG22_9PLEO|nr:hypothetical protein N0V83_001928 [Neocucurbitaria cava]
MLPASSHLSSRPKGQGLLLIWGGINPAITDEDALNDWWTKEHLPERLNLPGFQRAVRYRALNSDDGTGNYFTLYESSSVQDLASPEYLAALENPTPRTKQFMPCFAGMDRSACEVQWSQVDAAISSSTTKQARKYIMLTVLSALDDPSKIQTDLVVVLKQHLYGKTSPAIVGDTCTSIARANDEITKAGSVSKSYDNVQFTQRHGSTHDQRAGTLVALFEFCIPDASKIGTNDLFHSGWQEIFIRDLGRVGTKIEFWQIYKLMGTMNRHELKR